MALMSGGMDSTYAVYDVVNNPDTYGDLRHAVFINYGQKGAPWEWQAAKKIMDHLELRPHYLALPALGSILLGSIMGGSRTSLNPEIRDFAGRPGSFVPGRNLIHLAVVASLIDYYEIDNVVGGWNSLDVSYPDCRGEFLSSAAETITLALGRDAGSFGIVAPALNMTKAAMIKKATESSYQIPWHITRSCYGSHMYACGYCDSCLVRARAFLANGMSDPVYRTHDQWMKVVATVEAEACHE